LNLQFSNGIRLDVADPDNLGPFVSYDEGLQGIADLLDEAADDLGTAGDDFYFILSEGFDGFDTPASFLSFNRGLAARIALYQGNNANALKFLDDSFIDEIIDEPEKLFVGPFRPYSTAGGEEVNPVFRSPNQSEALVAHPDFVAILDTLDMRSAKVQEREDPIALDDLSGDHDVVRWSSLSSSIPYIRNEELILIRAEASIGTDANAAIAAIDLIRISNGIEAYSGGNSEAELIDEVLAQRRLSLYAEGHRWIDMRRYNRLDELPIDRVDDDVWEEFPRPVSEQE
ncbi:MAG: RagB/SusD family nutrient uptake outer membrane protein, partial [Bacteroidota bacterium]